WPPRLRATPSRLRLLVHEQGQGHVPDVSHTFGEILVHLEQQPGVSGRLEVLVPRADAGAPIANEGDALRRVTQESIGDEEASPRPEQAADGLPPRRARQAAGAPAGKDRGEGASTATLHTAP